ncbi:hypothetical protein CEUSTIGMA_g12044.t1 [Chlamydomonas eustigma]|uniref:Uncharacterized protein n=1 Tax=Chlamydomonas eustigma TaxID=1157962 RepID=A0A250XNQ1_9CHLO|nr:hypothetical protein CEUSTIGMA_g12044.t1 [Chlamydomonas eustigma]|eukprot:GAX84623.1 hypothetical protein CEUSTIGMA_g12044.t1 [Chlamydomonas eustigma]
MSVARSREDISGLMGWHHVVVELMQFIHECHDAGWFTWIKKEWVTLKYWKGRFDKWRGVRQVPGKGTPLTIISEGVESDSLPSPAGCEVTSKMNITDATFNNFSRPSPEANLKSRQSHQQHN